MVEVKEELIDIRCFCCFQEVNSNIGSFSEDLFEIVNTCFSIETPSWCAFASTSICNSCISRLQESYQFKCLILESHAKFNSIHLDNNPNFPSEVYDKIKPTRIQHAELVCSRKTVPKIKTEYPESDDGVTADSVRIIKVQNYWDYFRENEKANGTTAATDNGLFFPEVPPPAEYNGKTQHDILVDLMTRCQDIRVNLVKIEHLNGKTSRILNKKGTVNVKSQEFTRNASRETEYLKTALLRTSNTVPDAYTKKTRRVNKFDVKKRVIDNEPSEFKCSRCPESFRDNFHLAKHAKTHGDSQQNECAFCKSRFVDRRSLVDHLQFHVGVKNFQCPVCPKSFKSKSSLQHHQLRHNSTERFKCTLCPMSFMSKANLYYHRQRHSSVKRFQCTVCAKMYNLNSDLKAHMMIHNDARQFRCTLCPKFFKYKQSLKEHLQIHLGIKNFICTLCSKSFVKKSKLDRHMQIHCAP